MFATVLLALEAATAVAVPDLIKRLTDFLIDDRRPSLLGFTPSVDATIPLIALAIVVATAVNSSSASLAVIYLAQPRARSGSTCAARSSPTCSGCRWPSTSGAAPATSSPG